MPNLAAISENKEAFSILLQAKRDLRHEAFCLFSNLHTVWKHLPAEMQVDAKGLILQNIVEKGLLELSHSSSILDEQVDGLLKGHGGSVRAKMQQIHEQELIIKELVEKSERLQQQVGSLEQALEQSESKLSAIKRKISGFASAITEDDKNFFNKISTKDIVATLVEVADT